MRGARPRALDPEREIADCLDVIAQARHRCDDAFRQSEFREAAKKSLLARGEPVTGTPLAGELRRVRRKWVADKLIEAGVERATHWGWPNTYTYTKAIGEQIIAKSGLHHTVARPAICESTVVYPFRGWHEGISSSVPFMYILMKGQTHLPGGRDNVLDFVPSDLVASGMVLALLELLDGSEAPVYQLGASDINPCSSARFGELGGLYKRKHWQKKGNNPIASFVQSHYEGAVLSMDQIRALRRSGHGSRRAHRGEPAQADSAQARGQGPRQHRQGPGAHRRAPHDVRAVLRQLARPILVRERAHRVRAPACRVQGRRSLEPRDD